MMTKTKQPKYIFVTGGVLSGLGKGITAASIGNVLKARGFKVNMQKFDPYLNFDAGTLNPAEHGEVFVTDDGAETDLDLGHYERFLDQNLSGNSSVMTGAIYQKVFQNERQGKYLGQTVQIIPHVINEVHRRAREGAEGSHCDINIIEVGGTIGDNEAFHFFEAARRMRLEEESGNILYVHVVFLPYLKASDEVKTKPAQHSVEQLRSIGIQPDILVARADHPIPPGQIKKLSTYTNVKPEAILPLPTVDSVYSVPLIIEEYKLDQVIMSKLELKGKTKPASTWRKFVSSIAAEKEAVTIAMVGKYTTMLDTYASVVEALKAACWHNQRDLNLRWIDAEEVEQRGAAEFLQGVQGIVVPGGFGTRGTEGKIEAIRYAREQNIPYFGLCLGMQLATIEFARNVAKIPQATSQEFIDEGDQSAKRLERCVIHIMEDQKVIKQKGGTMRLGGWDCILVPDTFAREAYGKKDIRERHRHRYEFNNDFREPLTKAGLTISGTTPDGKLVEIIELVDHPWFVGVQFHPEFTSRPITGHPLFNAFIQAAKSEAVNASQ